MALLTPLPTYASAQLSSTFKALLKHCIASKHLFSLVNSAPRATCDIASFRVCPRLKLSAESCASKRSFFARHGRAETSESIFTVSLAPRLGFSRSRSISSSSSYETFEKFLNHIMQIDVRINKIINGIEKF